MRNDTISKKKKENTTQVGKTVLPYASIKFIDNNMSAVRHLDVI